METEASQSTGRAFYPLAVIAGAVTDVVGSNVIALCYGTIYAVTAMPGMIEQGLSQQEATARLTEQATGSPILLVLGLAMSILGGYVAGRIAKRNRVLHALGAALLLLVFGIIVNLVVTGSPLGAARVAGSLPAWAGPILTVAQVLVTMLGGYIAKLMHEHPAEA
jgi:hypothetical protein